MMNFEERRAEIFRRSDERIKTRKQNRKRILLSCLPIILCVGILSVSYTKNVLDAESTDGTIDNLPLNNYSLTYPVFIEVTDLKSGESREIDGCYNIATVTDIINSKTEGFGQNDNYGAPTENTDTTPSQTISDTDFYEISITRENEAGEKSVNVFILNGNVLTDKDTQQEYLLSDTELEKLFTVLGLEY